MSLDERLARFPPKRSKSVSYREAGIGHAPHIEAPERINALIREFVR